MSEKELDLMDAAKLALEVPEDLAQLTWLTQSLEHGRQPLKNANHQNSPISATSRSSRRT